MNKKSSIQRLLDKIVKAKEEKFSLSYNPKKDDEDYKAYLLYSSSTIESYAQYKHYASFYGYKTLTKDVLFKWYKFFFEVRTDILFAQDLHPTKENFLKNLPKETSKWSKKDYNSLKEYVINEVHEDSEWYFKTYKVRKSK